MKLVTVEFAHILRDHGYPQEMHVGDYAWHHHAKKIVRCTLVRKSPKGVEPVDDPVLKMPSEKAAEAFLHTLSPQQIVDIRRDLLVATRPDTQIHEAAILS